MAQEGADTVFLVAVLFVKHCRCNPYPEVVLEAVDIASLADVLIVQYCDLWLEVDQEVVGILPLLAVLHAQHYCRRSCFDRA